MKLDILAFGAHPDDVEMSAAGLLLQEINRGKKVGIVDLTQGELGTRGNAMLRKKEASNATKILGISIRHNLAMRDGFLVNDETQQLEVVKMIRHHQPAIVLANATRDRHPDHGKGAQLLRDAFFLSGLPKITTTYKGKQQAAWRPFHLFHYMQDMQIPVHFYVDISPFWQRKKEAILAYSSQFFDPTYHKKNEKESDTYISTKNFFQAFEARHVYYGRMIGTEYAEAYQVVKPLGVRNLDFLIDAPF